MRCYRCPAAHEIHYAESYECDFVCLAGVPENEMSDDKYGELGCRYNGRTIKKRQKMMEHAREQDCSAFVAWYLKELENDKQHTECQDDTAATEGSTEIF